MKRLAFALAVVLLIAGQAWAGMQRIEATDRPGFAQVIQSKGYACNQCNEGFVVGEDHKGIVFRIMCNDDALAYRVIVTPNNSFIVAPWEN